MEWATLARSRLARRRAEKPTTKAGQIRALWPDIEAALAVGQSLRTICAWLAEDAGISLGVTSLSSYVSRIRRREAAGRSSFPRPTSVSNSNPPISSLVPTPTAIAQLLTSSEANPSARRDPLANVRAGLAKRPGFDYHPATEDDIKDLI
jgi:hypothetical protein